LWKICTAFEYFPQKEGTREAIGVSDCRGNVQRLTRILLLLYVRGENGEEECGSIEKKVCGENRNMIKRKGTSILVYIEIEPDISAEGRWLVSEIQHTYSVGRKLRLTLSNLYSLEDGS